MARARNAVASVHAFLDGVESATRLARSLPDAASALDGAVRSSLVRAAAGEDPQALVGATLQDATVTFLGTHGEDMDKLLAVRRLLTGDRPRRNKDP